MTEKINYIPGRLKNAALGGHVAGAVDIIDDELLMTLAEINEMLLGGSITVSLTSNVPNNATFIGEGRSLTLTANCSVTATTIQITGGSISSPTTGTNTKTHSQTDSITNVALNITYNAKFMIGGLEKNVTRTIYAVHPIYAGAGATYNSVAINANRLTPRTSYNGTYNINNPTNAQYIWFLIPASISTAKPTAKMNDFKFPLDDAVNVTIGSVAYKAYRSSSTQDAGNYKIVLS